MSKIPTDAEVEEALNEEAILTDMGYFVGGDPMKMSRTGEDDCVVQARDSLLRRFATLRAALAAKDERDAETFRKGWNAGFRGAAEWQQRMLDNGPTRPGAPVHDENQQMIHATLREADRREGK